MTLNSPTPGWEPPRRNQAIGCLLFAAAVVIILLVVVWVL